MLYSVAGSRRMVCGGARLMNIRLSQPDRDLELKGPKQVKLLLRELNIVPETVLVIRDNVLLTEDETIRDSDRIEIRPVISGGCR